MVKPRPQSDQNGVAAWTAAIARGDERALARMLSLIEARAPIALEVLRELYGRTGKAAVVGVTGAAGSGKSTLIAALAEEFRRRQKKIGILTVDPTSPLTGGALLGDRVRMRELFLDRGVFIRSLANRGHAGGVAGALHQSVQLLDAAGKEVILVETIGVGQDQVEIADIAETVVLLMTPESGDEVQAMKAGIIELADIFVINKADLPGAGALREKLLSVIDVGEEKLYLASATRRDGMSALADGILRHREQLHADHRQRDNELVRARAQLWAALRETVLVRLEKQIGSADTEQWAQKIAERRSDPYSAAETLLAGFATESVSTQRPDKRKQ